MVQLLKRKTIKLITIDEYSQQYKANYYYLVHLLIIINSA